MEREDFTSDNPCDGAPGGGEERNVEAHKGDEDLLSSGVADGNGDTDDGDEVLAQAHADGTDEEKTTATEAFDTPHTGEGHDDVNDVGDDGDNERILDARILEEGRAVVEDEVN